MDLFGCPHILSDVFSCFLLAPIWGCSGGAKMGVFWNGTPGFGALEPLWLGCAFGAYDCLMPVAPSAGGCQEGARRGPRMVPFRIQDPIWTPNVSNLDLRTRISTLRTRIWGSGAPLRPLRGLSHMGPERPKRREESYIRICELLHAHGVISCGNTFVTCCLHL